MTEQEREIEELRAKIDNISGTLKKALNDLLFVLNKRSLCEICEYADAECMPNSGQCVPKWRGWS